MPIQVTTKTGGAEYDGTAGAGLLAQLGRFGAIDWLFYEWAERPTFPL